jgi:DNA replication and repair protein RecF
MILQSLLLHDFRNHPKTEIEWSRGRNILIGKNGEGKTNILEGIAFLCLGRSFYAASDAVVLRLHTESFKVHGEFKADRDVVFTVDVVYNKNQGSRRIQVGGGDLERRVDLIGMFPVVVLSPEHATITTGGPGERRRMVDTVLAQAQKTYLEDLVEYRKALRQRNKILLDGKISRRVDEAALSPWTDILVERGARITERRELFVDEFLPHIQRTVSELSDNMEDPTIVYESSVFETISRNGVNTRDAFKTRLKGVQSDEVRSGTTLVGPHRDEFDFRINSLSLRQYASQGQHKTFLIGLKFAEFHFLKGLCDETPILLLDDVLSELDGERNACVFRLTEEAGQTFVTAADARLLPPDEEKVETRRFVVQEGTVIE